MSLYENKETKLIKSEPLVRTPFCEIWKSEQSDKAHLILGDLSIRLDWMQLAGISSSINMAMHRKKSDNRCCKGQKIKPRVIN